MTKTYLKNKINRGVFLTLSTISIFFSNQAFAADCNIRWSPYGGENGLYAPDDNQYCIERGGAGDCNIIMRKWKGRMYGRAILRKESLGS